LAAKLRPGGVRSAEGWDELLLPEIERQQKLGKEAVFRADAAFATPEIYEAPREGTNETNGCPRRGRMYTGWWPGGQNGNSG
jgi:hypothetical protein